MYDDDYPLQADAAGEATEPQAVNMEATPPASTNAEATDSIMWFAAARGGERQGPISFSAIQGLVRTGKLAATDLVWHEGMSGWTMVQHTNELSGLLPTTSHSATPPPLPQSFAGLSTDPGRLQA